MILGHDERDAVHYHAMVGIWEPRLSYLLEQDGTNPPLTTSIDVLVPKL